MINKVDHYVRLTRKITLPPMQVHKMVGVAKIQILSKRLNAMTESLPAQEAIEGIEAVSSYKTFKQGGNRVTIGLQNMTREKIILKKGTKIARVSAANIVPPMLAPDLSTDRNELEYMLNGVDLGCVPEYKKLDLQEVKKTRINAKCFFLKLCKLLFTGFLVASYPECTVFFVRLFWGMVVRGCARRDLC